MGKKKNSEIKQEMISNLLTDLASDQDPLETNPFASDLITEQPSDAATEILDAHNIDRVAELPTDSKATEIVHALESPVTQVKNKPSIGAGIGSESKLQMAQYLKIAQDKIIELEKEVDRLREENDLLVIAAQSSKKQAEDFSERLSKFEQQRVESLEQAQMEINIFRENLGAKERERKIMEERIRQLEGSVSKEIKKIRIRERELENRLEISKQERIALVRAKDDTILDLRRKIDDLNSEIENYRRKYSELQKKSEFQHGQLSRTVKALRLALAHLDSESDSQVVPLKKAE